MKIKTGHGWPHDVTKKDLCISFCRSSGKGGQNVNKRDTACRIKHIPTGLQVFSQEHRTAELNKAASWKKLCDILVPMMKQIHRSDSLVKQEEKRIRTYNEKTQRVKDVRLKKQYCYTEVLSGNGLDKLISDLIKEG